MARKRFIPTSNYALSTTKGHSVLRQRHYSPAFHRRPVDDLYVYEPTYVPRPSLYSYDTSGNENYNRSEVNRELLLSTAAMEDSFDIASKSRNRDRDVLSAANKAIVATETHSSPRSAVAARRAQRGHAQPVVYSSPKNVQKKEVVLVRARANPIHKRNPPPASAVRPRVTVKPSRYARVDSLDTVGDATATRREPLLLLAYLRNLELMLLSKSKKASSTYVPYVPHRRVKKAALVGRKVDIVLPDKKKPKSKYAQAKMRQIKLEHRDDSPAAAGATSALRASKPVRPPRLIKPIRDVDGFKNPNNLLSWKYKLEAVTPPDDIIYAPKSLNSLRARLSDAKEKMDRHRQLMDRYLPTDDGLSPEDRRGKISQFATAV